MSSPTKNSAARRGLVTMLAAVCVHAAAQRQTDQLANAVPVPAPAPVSAPAAETASVPAPDPAALALRATLAARYPNTQFGTIEASAVPGLWEVWMGNNVAYVTDEARHFIFGHLYDMQRQTDLTAEKLAQRVTQPATSAAPADAPSSIRYADLPLQDAIKTVRGNGSRKLAVFSDPDCPYCRQLEGQLAALDDVTIYTFLYPLDTLHPQAATIAQSIWCAIDRSAAWRAYMLTGQQPPARRCPNPIRRNVALATSSGIDGTPFLLFVDGGSAAGALDKASLERRLGGQRAGSTP